MSENEIMKLMDTINYGWIDKNGIKHIDDFKTFSDDYILQSPEELINNKIGICWDQVELERECFKNYKSLKTFFLVHYDNDICPTHTFLTYEKDNKYYWFEHSWKKFKGIHEYNSLNDLLINVKQYFVEFELKNNYDENNLIMRKYTKPKYNITAQGFFKHCGKGEVIKI